MELFFSTISSFPTIIYTFLIFVAVIFWGIAALGLLDIDVLDFGGVDTDIGGVDGSDGHLDVTHTSDIQGGWFAGLLMKLGLDSVPLTIILTVFFFIGWALCYFAQLLLFSIPLGILRIPVGIVIFLASIFPAAYLTGWTCKPLRKIFKKLNEEQNATSAASLIGQVAIVRSGKVTETFGEAIYDDKGAGLHLRIRADESLGLQRNDRVVLIEYLENGAYKVVSEDEFNGL